MPSTMHTFNVDFASRSSKRFTVRGNTRLDGIQNVLTAIENDHPSIDHQEITTIEHIPDDPDPHNATATAIAYASNVDPATVRTRGKLDLARDHGECAIMQGDIQRSEKTEFVRAYVSYMKVPHAPSE